MAAKKYYAIAKGKQTGVFQAPWAQVKQLVEGYPGARYKGFATEQAALTWLQAPQKTVKKPAQKQPVSQQAEQSASVIYVYTDGGSRNTGNIAGGHVKTGDKAAWAYLLTYQGKQLSDSAGEFGATNNKMEIMALVKALQRVKAVWGTQSPLVVVADSRYVLNAITKNWLAGWQRRGWQRSGGQPLANKALWQQLAQLLPQFKQIDYQWTKGHATNAGNVFVDQALNRTMDQLTAAPNKS